MPFSYQETFSLTFFADPAAVRPRIRQMTISKLTTDHFLESNAQRGFMFIEAVVRCAYCINPLTSIETRIVSLGNLVPYMKLMKSVVSFRYDFCCVANLG